MENTRNTVFTNCKRQRRRTSLLLDSCFSIVSEPEQAACSKHAVQIQLQNCKNFTQVVMQFRKARLEYISTFSLLCTPWMAVVIHTSGVTCKVQSSKCIHICTAGYIYLSAKPDIKHIVKWTDWLNSWLDENCIHNCEACSGLPQLAIAVSVVSWYNHWLP